MGIREDILEKAADSVGHMFRRRVEATPNKLAFMYPEAAADMPVGWTKLTWQETNDVVERLAV